MYWQTVTLSPDEKQQLKQLLYSLVKIPIFVGLERSRGQSIYCHIHWLALAIIRTSTCLSKLKQSYTIPASVQYWIMLQVYGDTFANPSVIQFKIRRYKYFYASNVAIKGDVEWVTSHKYDQTMAKISEYEPWTFNT